MTVLAIVAVASLLILLMRSARPDEAGAASSAAPLTPGLTVDTSTSAPSIRLSVNQLVRRYSLQDVDAWRVLSVGTGPITSRAWLLGTLAEVGVPLGSLFELAQTGEPGGPVTKTATPIASLPPDAARVLDLAQIKSQIFSILSSCTPAPRRINAAGDSVTYTPDALKAQDFGEYFSSQFPALGIRLVNAQQSARMDELLARASQYSFAEQKAAGF